MLERIGSSLTFEGRLPRYRLAGVTAIAWPRYRPDIAEGASKNFLFQPPCKSDSRLAGSERTEQYPKSRKVAASWIVGYSCFVLLAPPKRESRAMKVRSPRRVTSLLLGFYDSAVQAA